MDRPMPPPGPPALPDRKAQTQANTYNNGVANGASMAVAPPQESTPVKKAKDPEKMRRIRKKVVEEILSTERSYVESLKRVVTGNVSTLVAAAVCVFIRSLPLCRVFWGCRVCVYVCVSVFLFLFLLLHFTDTLKTNSFLPTFDEFGSLPTPVLFTYPQHIHTHSLLPSLPLSLPPSLPPSLYRISTAITMPCE
jgi:hypothetical protein